MATIRIPRLVGKTNGSGLTSWYWQPSATLRRRGWHPRPLGTGGTLEAIPDDVATAARKLNLDVDGAAELPLQQLRRVQRPLTVDQLIARYEVSGFPSVKKSRQGKPVEPATRRQYRSKFRTIGTWGHGVALSSVTPERVVKLRDALMKPIPNPNAEPGSDDGRVRHYAAHETLRVARTLFTWAEQQHFIAKGANPFVDFGLAAPEERDQVWWPAAREAVLDQADHAGEPNMALAIDLAFQIGQREADLLRIILTQWQAIPLYKIDPEVYHALSLVEVPAFGAKGSERPAYVPGDVFGVRIRQAKGKRWVEVPIVGLTRARVEAAIADAKRRGLTSLLFDERVGMPWTMPSLEAGQRRFIRRFAELRAAAIATAAERQDHQLAAELGELQYRDFRRTAVVHQGELGIADQLISAITGHTLDKTRKILEIYMPRTTGMAARAIALSVSRQSGTLARAGETA